jgi:RimJ/RimL family protein N-acetyltransferase
MCEIKTPRLCLRPFEPSDLEAYHAAVYGDAEVMRFMPGGVPREKTQTEALIQEFIAFKRDHCFGAWAVVYEDRVIGHCGLIYIPNTREIELFYALGKAHWGSGLTTEAAKAVLDYGFETCELRLIHALAVPENVASTRVMEKIGLAYQGVTKRYYGGTPLAHYQITRNEYLGICMT